MAATTTLWASGTPTTTGTTWTNAANAAGTNNATFATFTTATNGAVGVINMTGYGAQTAIGAQPTSVDSVVVNVFQYVAATARWTSVTVAVYNGATIIGTAQTATLSATTTNSQTFTFTGVTWAALANLTVRVTATKTGTQSSTANVDAASVVVNYTPPATTHPAAGVAAAVSATTGAASVVPASVTHPASGLVAASSVTSGALALLAATSGIVAALSGMSGAAIVVPGPVIHAASGAVAGTSTTTGTVTARFPASGSTASVGGTAGAVTLRAAASGITSGTTGTAGAVTIVPGFITHQASGSVAATSGTSGAASTLACAAGVIAVESVMTGAVQINGGDSPVALLAEYGFDINGSGSITDLSGNGRTGTISGDTAWTSPGHDSNGCIYNPSSRADGSGVHIPRTGLEPSSALTVMCWVSSQETGDGYRNAVSKSRAGDSDSYSLYTSYPQLNRPAMTISTTAGFHQATAPTALLSGGGWHHLAGTYDGANLILYVDGTAITTVAATGTLAYTTTDLTILKSQAWPTYSATAKIDDVRIYDAALTGAEITALMGTPAGSGTVHQAAGLMAATSATSGTVAATYKAAGAAAATSSTKGAASIAGDLVIITPAARTYAVAAESRTYLVQQ